MIIQNPSFKSRNFFTSLLLLLTAFFKATDNTLISDSFETIAFGVSGIVAAVNILTKVEWKALFSLDFKNIDFLNFAKSSNFYLQFWAVLVSLFPIIESFLSSSDVEQIVGGVQTGNTTTVIGLVWALLIKIVASVTKGKTT